MRFRALLVTLFSLLLVNSALAVTPYSTLNSVANVATMKANNFGGVPQIQLRGYYSDGDGGEGAFSYFAGACSEDGGSIIKDGAGNCFKRANLNGKLAQYGVTDGSVYDWNTHGISSTDISSVLTAAGTAAQAIGLTTLHTNGISVYLATSYTQPSKLTVTCDQTVGVPQSGRWFDTLKGAVYEAHGVEWHTAGRIIGRNHCYLAASFLIAGVPTNAQQSSALLANMISNGDTGLFCDTRGCDDNNLFIVGFDTGYEATGAGENRLTDAYIDANVCEWITGAGSNPSWRNVNCFGYLTQTAGGKQEDFNITKVENSSGLCKVTVTAAGGSNPGTLADLIYANYIYITGLTSTSNGCEGQWHISNIDTGAGTFTLVGSAVLGPTTFGHWALGSNVIYVSDGTNIASGEVINGLDAQGIPTGTTVTAAWPLPPNTDGYLTDTGGSANTYVANAASGMEPCLLVDVLNVAFTAAHTNTSASTLNITLNSGTGCTGGTTGPIAIVHIDGTALIANDIIAGAHILVRYSTDLSKWVLIQPKVVLSVPTTVVQSTNQSITFTNAVCSSCGANPQASFLFTARVDAGGSDGGVAAGGTGFATGTLVGGPSPKSIDASNRVAGFQADQLFDFDHSIELHIENSNESGITNFGTDSHGGTDNPNTVILLVDGESNNAHVLGRKAGKGGRSIVTNVTYPNSPDRGCVTWTGAAVAATTGSLPVMDVEQGCLRVINGVTNSGGVDLVSHFANQFRLDAYQPNITVYAEDATAQAAIDTTGSQLEGGNSNPQFIANMAPVQTVTGSINTTAVFWPCDATGGAVQLTLPAAATVGNHQFTVQKVGTSANTCKVVPHGSDTFIGGPSNITLSTQGQYATFASNGGTIWYIYPVAASNVIAQSGAAVSVPADTTEDTLATIILQRNTMGANGCVLVDFLTSWTASANLKTVRVYLGTTGTTAFTSVASTALVSGARPMAKICNANATNAQVGVNITGLTGLGAAVTGAVDTTSNANLIITGQKASAGETLTLTEYTVTVVPHS